MNAHYDNKAGLIDYVVLHDDKMNFSKMSLEELTERKERAELQLESYGQAYRLSGSSDYLDKFENLNRFLFSLKREIQKKKKAGKSDLKRTVMESSKVKTLQSEIAQLRNKLDKEQAQHAQAQRFKQRELTEYDELKNLLIDQFGLDEVSALLNRAKLIADTILEHKGGATC